MKNKKKLLSLSIATLLGSTSMLANAYQWGFENDGSSVAGLPAVADVDINKDSATIPSSGSSGKTYVIGLIGSGVDGAFIDQSKLLNQGGVIGLDVNDSPNGTAITMANLKDYSGSGAGTAAASVILETLGPDTEVKLALCTASETVVSTFANSPNIKYIRDESTEAKLKVCLDYFAGLNDGDTEVIAVSSDVGSAEVVRTNRLFLKYFQELAKIGEWSVNLDIVDLNDDGVNDPINGMDVIAEFNTALENFINKYAPGTSYNAATLDDLNGLMEDLLINTVIQTYTPTEAPHVFTGNNASSRWLVPV